MMQILVIEDDARICADITAALEANHYVVDCVRDGEEAWFKGDTEDYAGAILDLGLPQMDGMSVLKHWRANRRDFPVLVLTARGTWTERVEGIDAGADDYLPKPFAMEELLARLRAILRRRSGLASPLIRIGDITLDTRLMRVFRNGVPLALSPQEYRLVAYLMHHPSRVVPQQELAEQLQGDVYERELNAVEVLVGRVRRKLGTHVIETHRGFGYSIAGALGSEP